MPSNHYNYNKQLRPLATSNRLKGTKAEVRAWCELFRNKQMLGYDFTKQRPVENYIVDFFCKKLKLIVEIDGLTHYSEEGHQKDLLRDKALKALGYTTLRFNDDEVMNHLEGVRRSIEGWIAEHAG